MSTSTDWRDSSFPSLQERQDREKLADRQLRNFLDEAGGSCESPDDLTPVLMKQMGEPRNGVLNALKRATGHEDRPIAHVSAASFDPRDPAGRIIKIYYFESPAHDS